MPKNLILIAMGIIIMGGKCYVNELSDLSPEFEEFEALSHILPLVKNALWFLLLFLL